MKLIEFLSYHDFGKNMCFYVLKGTKYTLIQCDFGWDDYPGGPYIQITTGMGRLFGILISVYKFSFCIEFLSRTWRIG